MLMVEEQLAEALAYALSPHWCPNTDKQRLFK